MGGRGASLTRGYLTYDRAPLISRSAASKERPAGGGPDCPSTTPYTIRLACDLTPFTCAAHIRQPPAAPVQPVLMPTTPLCPSRRLWLRTTPATGTLADVSLTTF